MSLEIFLLLLLIVSIFTGLFTEGIKKLMDEVNKKYLSNFLAGFVAVVLSVLVDAGYIILTEAQINAKMAVYLIALVLLSWLASMVGYDKVIQAMGLKCQCKPELCCIAYRDSIFRTESIQLAKSDFRTERKN